MAELRYAGPDPTTADGLVDRGYLEAATGQLATTYTGLTRVTLWYGTQAQYDALAGGVKTAAGFIAYITG